MALLLLFGGILTGSAFWVQEFFAPADVQNLAVTQSILTNFGTGFVSAGLLLLVEPKLRRVVTATVNTATARIREDVRNDVQNDIDQKFASLSEEIRTSVQSRMADQDATLADFGAQFTHEVAMDAMRLATDMNALGWQSIRVQARDEPGELHIGLTLRLPNELTGPTRFHGGDQYGPEDEVLHLAAYPRKFRAQAEVVWESGQSFASVVLDLLEALHRTDGWGMADEIDWDTVTERIAGGLKVAVESRRKNPGSIHLRGPLLEVIGGIDPWYITTESIECPAYDYTLPRTKFPSAVTRPGPLSPAPTPVAEKPEWADQKEWTYVLSRATEHFTSFLY